MSHHKGRLHTCPRYCTVGQVEKMNTQAYIMCYKVKPREEYDWQTADDGETHFPVKFDVRPVIVPEAEKGHYRLAGISRGVAIEAYAYLDSEIGGPSNHTMF